MVFYNNVVKMVEHKDMFTLFIVRIPYMFTLFEYQDPIAFGFAFGDGWNYYSNRTQL